MWSRARISKEGYLTVPPNSSAKCWVGIDVSKDWIDVEVLAEEQKVEVLRCGRLPQELAQQLILQRAAERTRLQQASEPQLNQSIKRVITFLGKELARLEKHMAAWIERIETFR